MLTSACVASGTASAVNPATIVILEILLVAQNDFFLGGIDATTFYLES